jgi:hypothetical protein
MDNTQQKFIVHSACGAAHQPRLCIQQLKRFFPRWGKVQSQITNPKSTETRRFNITQLAAHFATHFISWSTVKQKKKEKAKATTLPQCPASMIRTGCQPQGFPQSARTRHVK